MASFLPRAAYSAITECMSSGLARTSSSRILRSPQAANSIRCVSTSRRYAAAPASTPSYVRRPPAEATRPAAPKQATAPSVPPPAKQSSIDDQSSIKDMTSGLADEPLILDEGSRQVDWTRSFHGLSAQPFSKEAADILLAPIPTDDVEIKPDGIMYLPEIKYRRILNRAFGPGGWGLAPRGETIVTGKSITREYALVAHGRLVSVARGEQDYFSPEGIPTATEGCKSNALMRCCKDLGVASELWDPRYNRKFMKEHAKQIWVEHVPTKKKKQMWLRKDDEPRYPFKQSKFGE
ncbi:probable mitochondrial genome maintenance protein MGM101 [Rhynchosporium agropyri]|uniref:Mitochondrial genome maintenance protein MGM101 n=1 Tax=Rhynchosporium agropyri TaxID=914238 RepID=A0A1E1LBB5_9HELO|nr:probable mitochondrial genome maintenance protein MGM101 [Rhynchosporium agropyri]